MVYLVAILFYLLFLTGVGLYKSRQVKTGADFSVAGRTLSPWVVVLTMLAVWIGTGSIVGEAEQAYERGMAALILPLGTFIGLLILAQIAGKARGFEVYSVPEIIGSRYGRVARMLAVVSLIIAYMVILSYQFNAGGAVLEVITGDRTAVVLQPGDILSRHQIVKGFVQFTPDGDWSGTAALALAAKSGEGWSEKPVEIVVNVVSKESVIKAREELKAKGTDNTIVIKENNFAKYNMADLSNDFDKENEFRIVSVPQPGKLELIEPILTARTATIIAAVFIITYTVLAGLMSLAYCDVFNGSIILIGMLIAFPFLLVKAGGFAGMERAFAAMGDRPHQMQFWGVYSWPQLFNYLMPPFLLIMGDANLYQRFFACRSAKGARQAAYTMVFLAILVELLIIASVGGGQFNPRPGEREIYPDLFCQTLYADSIGPAVYGDGGCDYRFHRRIIFADSGDDLYSGRVYDVYKSEGRRKKGCFFQQTFGAGIRGRRIRGDIDVFGKDRLF